MRKVAIDFGTTNTAIAVWREATSSPETISLPNVSVTSANMLPPLIPSLVYVKDGASGEVVIGSSVQSQGLNDGNDDRFFRSFKRAIASPTRAFPREIDGEPWDDIRAGSVFLQTVVGKLIQSADDVPEEVILTVPVDSFEYYLKWLRAESSIWDDREQDGIQNVRVVDESTAAALGYGIRTPGELILVIDFGGGTLDISLVRMPIAEDSHTILESTDESNRREANNPVGSSAEARVIAKAGRILGGDDIDYWLIDEVLKRNDVNRDDIGLAFENLKRGVELAKIALSDREDADVSILDPVNMRTYGATLTRTQLEAILDERGFYEMVQRTLDKVLRAARARGIFAEDIGAVLLVGGTSQIPSVQRMIRAAFGSERVHMHKPFEAVAHGALALSVGMGVDDYLYHAYGIRHLSPITRRHEWEEIIPAGTRYPLDEPIRLTLTASYDDQEVLELVIGEVEDSTGGITEVMFGDRAILMVDGGMEMRRVVALNADEGARTVAYLNPPGRAGEDRVEVAFNVDQNRMLRVTVSDLLHRKTLLHDVPVVELR